MADRGTYIKMSDSLPEHRKIVAAGGDAGWLHICALAYASRNRTDGFIPENMVARLSDRRQPAKLAARLCDVELWHAPGHECKRCPQPAAGEYIIHDYLEHQRSAARIEEISEKRAEGGRRGGTKSKPKPKQVASGLLRGGFDSAEAKPTPDTEEVLRTSQTDTDPEIQPPTASAARTPTQRAKPITDAYAKAQPMCRWPAINGVVIHAIKAGKYADDEIHDALLRMAKSGQSVTVESLRVEIEGLAPRGNDRREQARADQRQRQMQRAIEREKSG